MKYQTMMKRRKETEVLAKGLVEKAIRRSKELNQGRIEWAFVAGYMESALADVVSCSPAATKALKGIL